MHPNERLVSRARADSAWRQLRCEEASPRPTLAVAWWTARPRTGSGRDVTGDPRVDEEFVLIDQIQPIEFCRELAANKKHTRRSRVLEFLYTRAKVASDVVAIGPRVVLSRRGHHILRLGFQLDRPLANRGWCVYVAPRDRRPVALHHLVGDATPQHRPALVHEAGKECVCFVVSDPLLVIDAPVQRDVDAEYQESHVDSLRLTSPISRAAF